MDIVHQGQQPGAAELGESATEYTLAAALVLYDMVYLRHDVAHLPREHQHRMTRGHAALRVWSNDMKNVLNGIPEHSVTQVCALMEPY
jgi:hypothetical protein